MPAKKVIFKLEQDEDGYPPFALESLWAEGNNEDGYIIDNIPFYVYEISVGDKISTTTADDGALYFNALIERSGNSTFRLFVKDVADSEEIKRKIEGLSCEVECDRKMGILAVNIPASSDIMALLDLLMLKKKNEEIDFEEGSLRHEI